MSAYPLEEEALELEASDLEDNELRAMFASGIRPTLEAQTFASRAELEWRLYQRCRFAPEHRRVSEAILQRLDEMYESLPSATTLKDAIFAVRSAFVNDGERRIALMPLMGVLYPLVRVDDTTPTEDIVRMIAEHEIRKPARPL